MTNENNTVQDSVALVARLLLATLFILAGVNKIGGMEGTVGYIASVGLPFPELVYFGTVALEIGAGLLLAIGFKARYAAGALGIFSLLTAIIFHNDFAQQSEVTALLKNFAIGGGMLAVAAFGPGRFSLDRG
ncbi:DoxX family protein [Altererythrobacter lutimaris]|uniref:DoxX family protein n=1 Tax=Altererythrobacter lutimaris TaxID=2743979 RepID=A0A850H9Q0_9SPHN|nr:DoxX family protein [Altererythrobacter lutimaris]NVE94210.1 DoxX family protein [Altererythrobacter lutimaris]